MNPIDILTKWAKYIEYDPNQKSFNLLSSDYTMHKCGKNIEALSKDFDETGTLAVIYAKNTFVSFLKEAKVKLFDIMNEPDSFKETQEMWDIFQSEEVREIEDSYLMSLDTLVKQVIGKTLIGEGNLNDIREPFCHAVDVVVENLAKCNEDVFLKGGPVDGIRYFSSHIHVFETLAECLIALEGAKDGMYLCYIKMRDSADGYFGYYIKSNGNIISINERVNEAYAGQHNNSRNGHWTEGKKYELFPYEFIFSFGEHDYKGYSNKHIIDDKKLSLFNLGAEAYFPIILAMVMLAKKYAGKTLEAPVKYVDSLLPVNVLSITGGENALVIPENSLIAASHNTLTIEFSNEGILSGEYNKKFNWHDNEDALCTEKGVYTGLGQEFVDLYGAGFKYDPEKVLVANAHLKRLETKDGEAPVFNAEFVGSQHRMEMEAYRNIREQLAEYIRGKIYEEYVSFGGAPAVRKWWRDTLEEKKPRIKQLCVEKMLALFAGTTPNVGKGWVSENPSMLAAISYERDTKWPSDYDCTLLNERPLDEKALRHGRKRYKFECIDEESGNICTQFFMFRPRTYKELEKMLEIEVPKIMKGWRADGHSTAGNPLLNSTDKVSEVGTPFEKDEYRRNNRYHTPENERYSTENDPQMDFKFVIGFSKRTLNRMLKEAGYQGSCTDPLPEYKKDMANTRINS